MSEYGTFFDLCIVGAGMIGSAAARHASAIPGTRICLIGPTEPQLGDDRDIYGAHYDEGRMACKCQWNEVMSEFAQKSIARFRQLEQESGIQFFEETGTLLACEQGDHMMKTFQSQVQKKKNEAELVDSEAVNSFFPYLKFPQSDIGFYESKHAGHVSPRKLILAEQRIAAKQGCTLIGEVVDHVSRVVQSNGSYVMKLVTDKRKVLFSHKVLLATGSFTTFRNLLPPGVVPEQSLCPLVVAKVEITGEEAHRLRRMPCISYTGRGHNDWYSGGKILNKPSGKIGFYMLPPIKYPDDRICLKLGIHHAFLEMPQSVVSSQEAKTWFCQGDTQVAQDTAKFLVSLFKDLNFISYHGDYCVITETSTRIPYIDKIHAQLGVAIGGNGGAAKSCDEIGRIAAQMMMKGVWDSDAPQELLKLRLADDIFSRPTTTSKL